MRPPPTKVDLIEYFQQLLHGPTGITSAEILADVVYERIREEKERCVGMVEYHAKRPNLKKEFRDFAWQIHNSVVCGPTYSSVQDNRENDEINATDLGGPLQKSTGAYWCSLFEIRMLDLKGWDLNGVDWNTMLTLQQFSYLWSLSGSSDNTNAKLRAQSSRISEKELTELGWKSPTSETKPSCPNCGGRFHYGDPPEDCRSCADAEDKLSPNQIGT